MSKVTMQDIADALDISRVSVWKVLNQHAGVSEDLKKNVMEKANEMGYFAKTASIIEPIASPLPEKTVSLIVSRPDSSTFWTNIIHRLAQELSYHNINLLYTYMPTAYAPGFTLPALLTNGTVQGALVLNVYDSNLIQLINELTIPTVFLDTVPDLNCRDLKGDLMLIEGFSSVYEITESVIQRGIHEIGFIGDIHYAKTNLDRYRGFCSCMENYNLPLKEEFCLTHSIGIFSYYQELSDFLDSLPTLPKAIICASDYIAHYLRAYFSEHEDRIPDGIVITGFDGSNEYTNIDGLITTANVKTSLLGKRLSMQLIYRMEHCDAPYELTYINPDIIYRDSILH